MGKNCQVIGQSEASKPAREQIKKLSFYLYSSNQRQTLPLSSTEQEERRVFPLWTNQKSPL